MKRITEYYELIESVIQKMGEDGITQTEMAKDLEVKQPYLNRVLKRKTIPSIEFAFKMVNYLSIKVGITH